MNHVAMKLLCRQASLVHELLITSHKRFPCCVMTLLHNPSKAEELAAMPRCVMDNWSLAMCSEFDNFRHPDLLEILVMHCLVCSTNISELECKHASNRRLLHQRGTQTWSLQVATGSSEWLAQCCRKTSTSPLVTCKQSAASVPHQRGKTKVKQKPKGKGGHGSGGAFRAFVHMKTLGQKGSCSFSQLAQEYAEAKRTAGSNFHAIQAVGRAATCAASSKRGVSAFGLKSRELQRKQIKAARAAMSERIMSLESTPQMQQLVDKAILPSFQLAEAVSQARVLRKAEGHKQQQSREALSQSLHAWESSEGPTFKAALLAALPAFHLEKDNIKLIPTPFGAAGSWACLPSHKATLAAAWSSHSHETNLSSAFEKEWLQRHQSISLASASSVVEPAQSPSKCQVHGLCLCSREGKALWTLRNRVLKILKTAFYGKAQRDMLGSGNIVLLFQSAGLETGAAQSSVPNSSGTSAWLHIAAMYFSPYKPVFSVLERLAIYADALEGHSVTPLKVVGKYLTEFEAMQLLDTSSSWSLSIYELEISLRPMACLKPSIVSVVPHAQSPTPHHVWPTLSQRGKRVGGARARKRQKICTPSQALVPSTKQVPCHWAHKVMRKQSLKLKLNMTWMRRAEHMNPLPIEDFLVEVGTLVAEDDAVESVNLGENDVGETTSVLGAQQTVPDATHEDADGGTIVQGNGAASTARAAPIRGMPMPSACTVHTPNGHISYYDHGNQAFFEAVCLKHKFCKLRRSSRGRESKQGVSGGRPLGFLMMWQSIADGSREDHWNRATWGTWSQEARMQKRSELADMVGSEVLLAAERARLADEPNEPAELKGLLK
eukprot:6483415-Amphidinium_carterae.1